MKKGFLFIIIICLAVFGSFGLVDFSEAKDKLSKYDRQILEEFKRSFTDSGDGRFQSTKMADATIVIIDTKLGHLWVFSISQNPVVKYAGKVKPGTTFWDTIYIKK